MGAFPRVAWWNDDALFDLLVGDALGQLWLFTNVGATGAPVFGAGVALEVGPAEGKIPINVGYRATPVYADWNGDGARDLVVGDLSGKIHLFLNSGSDTEPDFLAESLAQTATGDLVVDGVRSSPVVMDLDGDGDVDLLSGNTNGQVLYYENIGSGAAPLFDGFTLIEADGAPIDYDGTPRSRPFVGDWTGDGYLDLLAGQANGAVYLYEGGASDVASLPPLARLGLPWPNPANPRVNVNLQVDRIGDVVVTVHDAAGRRMATLYAGSVAPGSLELTWNGRDDSGRELPSGLYLITLRGAEMMEARKLMLLR